MSPGVLCEMVWDLQRCMVSLMQLDGDNIMVASLLGPADVGPRMPPTSEEEAALLGDEPESQEAQEVIISPPECPET